MGMQNEPGYIPPAGRITREEILRQAANAQRDAASSYVYAQAHIADGNLVRAVRFQQNAAEAARCARFLIGLPRS